MENPGRRILVQQWVLIAVAIACFTTFMVLNRIEFQDAYREQGQTLWTIAAGITLVLAQGLWITMDRRRQGKEVGWWRFGALFLGPLVVWIYLIVQYRIRSLYLIPLSVLIYIAAFFVPGIIIVCMDGLP